MSPRDKAEVGSNLLVKRADLARLLGVSSRQVSSLEADGVIQPARRGKGGKPSLFDAAEIVPAFIARLTTVSNGSDLSPRERKDTALARLAELKHAREIGELVDRDEILRSGRQLVISWCAALERLPREAVNRGAPRAVLGLLRTLVRDIRSAVASTESWRPIAGDAAAQVADASNLDGVYVSPAELRTRLADPAHHSQRVQPSLRRKYEALVAADRGIVEFQTGGWRPWPPTESEWSTAPEALLNG